MKISIFFKNAELRSKKALFRNIALLQAFYNKFPILSSFKDFS